MHDTMISSATAVDRWVGETFREWVALDAPGVPLPGGGRTWDRFGVLADMAKRDLALGRLAEGHADAVAILADAGTAPVASGPYGVWAARSRDGDLVASATASGWRIDGVKQFCSGVGLLDRALVSADGPDGPRLFDVDVRRAALEVCADSWPAVGMAASASASVVFHSVPAAARCAVGDPGFYTERVGFWWGAAGVAACWWGGARALIDTVASYLDPGGSGAHELAAFGEAVAQQRSMTETMRWAASEIDGVQNDVEHARRVALVAREVVHRGCGSILAAVAAAGGARPICMDAAQSRRSADLYAYLSQHHGGRDAAALGKASLTTQEIS